MNPKNTIIQILIVPFLFLMWFAAGYLVYRSNHEIMSTEPYYKILMKNHEISETLISGPGYDKSNYSEKPQIAVGHVSHRLGLIKDDNYKPIIAKSQSTTTTTTDNLLIVRDSTQVVVTSRSGDIKWSFTPPDKATFTLGQISLLGEALYLSTTNGNVYALNIQNGEVIWYMQRPVKYFYSPLVAKEKLLLFSEEKPNHTWSLDIVNVKTGKLINRISKLSHPLAGEPLIKNDVLYFANPSGNLHALNLESGKLLWSSEASASFLSGPSLINDKLYLSNEEGLVLGFERKLGRNISEIEVGNSISEPLILVEGTNNALTIDSKGYLIGIDLKAKSRLWRFNLNLDGASPALRLFRLSKQSLARLSFTSEVNGMTAWVSCNSNYICVFDAKGGQLLHRINLNEKILGPIEIFSNPINLLVPIKHGEHTEIVGLYALPDLDKPTPRP